MSICSMKKCSRCKSKRLEESEDELSKYSTCARCRAKRKIAPSPVGKIDVDKEMQNTRFKTEFEFSSFLAAASRNRVEDITDLRLVEINKDMPPFTISEIESQPDKSTFYSRIARKVTKLYIDPIASATNFKFVIRDHHNGGLRTKKVSLVFICAQDKTRQRKSRSSLKRAVSNRLKVHECFSSIHLSYDLLSSKVVIHYSHRSHPPIGHSESALYAQNPSQQLFRTSPALDGLKSPSSSLAVAAVGKLDKLEDIDDIDTLNIDNRLMQ